MVSDEVERFLRFLPARTAKTYRSGLRLFEEYYGGCAGKFLSDVYADRSKPIGERRHVEREVLSGFAKWLGERGKSPKTIRLYITAIQAFAKFEGVDISARYVSLPPERVMNVKYAFSSADEVDRFVSYLHDPLYRSIAVSIFQSGLSLIDLLQLRYVDIRDEFERGVSPICIRMYRQKTNVRFLTFLGLWSVLQLKEYFDAYGKPRPNEPVYRGNEKKEHMERLIEKHFASAARKFLKREKGLILRGRNPLSPHALRAAFNTLLADARMEPNDREFLMGHKLPEQTLAYLTRSEETWRQLYRQYEHILTPTRLRHLLNITSS